MLPQAYGDIRDPVAKKRLARVGNTCAVVRFEIAQLTAPQFSAPRGVADRRQNALIEITIVDSMTAPAAAAAILILFDSAAFAAVVSPIASEIETMTGSAETRVLGREIRNVFVIVLVTGPTGHVVVVVARIVAVVCMGVIDRRPALRGMTAITLCNGYEMIESSLRRIADRRNAVMT